MLSNNEDYQTMLESQGKNKSIKVYITLKSEKNMKVSTLSNSSSNKNTLEEYQILDTNKESVKEKNNYQICELNIPENVKKEANQEVDIDKEEPEIIKLDSDDHHKANEIEEIKIEEEKQPNNSSQIVSQDSAIESVPIKNELKMINLDSEQPLLKQSSIPSHPSVKCDGCGMLPIIGSRYHCSVCDDFDYCEVCEASKEHAHPFLKMKIPQPEPEPALQQVKNICGDWKAKTVDTLKNVYGKVGYGLSIPRNAIKKIFQTVDKDVSVPEVKAPEQYKIHNVTLVRELETVPKVVYPEDPHFFKTLIIKNTGILDFPDGCCIVNMDEPDGQRMLIPALEIEKEASCVIKVKCPQKPGKYKCNCQIAFINEFSEEEIIGNPFVVHYEISEKFSNDVMEKAKQLQELFPIPGKESTFYCEEVKKHGKAPLEDLIDKFLKKL